MASVYVHLSGRDVNEALLQTYGIKPEKEETKSKLIPRKCLRCNLENEPTNKFCKTCGLVLDEKEADKIIRIETEKESLDSVLNSILKDKDILTLIAQKVKDQGVLV